MEMECRCAFAITLPGVAWYVLTTGRASANGAWACTRTVSTAKTSPKPEWGQGSAAEGTPLQLKPDSDDGDDLKSCFEESSTAPGCVDTASKGAMNSESAIAEDVDVNDWSED